MRPLFLTAADAGAEARDFFTALRKLNLEVIIGAAIIFVIGYVLIKWVAKILTKVLARNPKLDPSIRALVVTVCRILLFFLLVLTCADKLGLPTTSIITLLGTFGLAFSLAMQNSLSNLAGGLFILVSKPFETGDYISVPGADGTVTQIGFIHTLLTTPDDKLIHVPNSTITGNTVVNYSQSPVRKVELTIPVPYECSLEQAKAVIRAVVEADGRVLEGGVIRVENLSASSVDIFLRLPCKSTDYWDLRSALLENIKVALDRAGISIPYNQLDVHLIDRK